MLESNVRYLQSSIKKEENLLDPNYVFSDWDNILFHVKSSFLKKINYVN